MSHDETKRIWNANAAWWDDRIGDGNDFQIELVEPATTELLALQPNERVLDVACGAGRYARLMAARCSQVVACDFSESFLERARQRTPASMTNITYHVVDLTVSDQLNGLGNSAFDAATCTMGLMDISDIEPLFSALPALLKPGARFVFTTAHPCFHSPRVTRFSESREDESGRLVSETGVKVHRYTSEFSYLGEGIVGQPEPQYYYHRSFETTLSIAFSAGFVLDGFLEPTFPERPDGAEGWSAMPEIPPVVAVRLRLL